MVGEPPSALEGIWEAKNAEAYDGEEDVGWIRQQGRVLHQGQRLRILDSCFHLVLT
ncbi:proton-coupled amino acid transporter 3-like [Pyrus ussuriensis x Pyrus communis]|uniref:Proton-coupled amino acid transporter 3-like n=1 Tax=Pyrus ussuriensis x Pyrus communis TaxID=2448454 RepID=A0A5N5GNM1_9ROSA|nr:proton-coupled amino acid transporter 3-like [Pyrus ussuriensis x Pyrus communis]